MEQMGSSSCSDGERSAKRSNRQQGAAMVAQSLPSQPSLKCPRCNSGNTKFCYYNNYSQTQPRHFCKSCRRYWTQGGTLRNVPVGGGCRKNKRVRPRSLISMGGLDHGPTPFSDAASNMLGRLSSIPTFGDGSGNASSGQLLNIAYERFQESMRMQQQMPNGSEGAHYSADMSLPALVHKPCGIASCTGGACANRGAGASLIVDSFENNMGFTALRAEAAGYYGNNYDMQKPALYAQTHNLMGTSATATLASIEDELSNFSNLTYHVNSISAAAAAADCATEEQKGGFDILPAGSGSQRMFSAPMQLHLQHGGSGFSYVENPLQSAANADLKSMQAEEQKPMREEKPLMSMGLMGGDHNGLSLMMPADNWQQQTPSINDRLFEPHHGIMWSTNAPIRWQDMHPTSVL